MGFFKKFSFKPFKAVRRIVKPVLKNPLKAAKSFANQVIKNPARATAAVLSGGTTELWRAAPIVGKAYATAFDKVYSPIFDAAGNYLIGPEYGIIQKFGAKLTEEKPMAFNIGGLLGSVGGILKSTNSTGNPYVSALSTGFDIFSAATAKPRMPAPSAPQNRAMTITPGAQVAIAGAAKGLTKEIFVAGTKILGRLGIPFKATPGSFAGALKRALGSIASLARRVPNGTMVSILAGLGLTALESYMLVSWYAQKKKRRRMNPANSRALRRAARRIKSFHKLCQHTDLIKTHRRSAPSFGRKCGTCRKNPCGC